MNGNSICYISVEHSCSRIWRPEFKRNYVISLPVTRFYRTAIRFFFKATVPCGCEMRFKDFKTQNKVMKIDFSSPGDKIKLFS